MFSNACRVLSPCNTRFRLHYLLNKGREESLREVTVRSDLVTACQSFITSSKNPSFQMFYIAHPNYVKARGHTQAKENRNDCRGVSLEEKRMLTLSKASIIGTSFFLRFFWSHRPWFLLPYHCYLKFSYFLMNSLTIDVVPSKAKKFIS